ncbi:MAG: aspartate carbamoyltransferase [Bacteroidetes bacterium]|nr:aspartate carbamoyltransferase [Bacteroidota bacterium]MBU1423319.1 aspartate carbamoyltransferase [Bacteroidota bacterium]MBU2636266.1 aspartate carbamoyltransferase [Bacteroidota bacterium]
MKLKHIIKSQQFSVPSIMELFATAQQMEKVVARGGTQDYNSKIMASLFYEPSTRTRFSFETAMHRLGGRILSTENAKEFSSAISGESIEDTIKVLSQFVDVIVLRHDEIGGAERAAAVSNVPVINAGDGKGGQHPTQALTDLYTIFREIKTIDGLNIALVGDLAHGRTVRSLAYLLSKFERVKIFFVAPDKLQIHQDILDHLEENKVWFAQENDLKKVVAEVDVVYQTRIEKILLEVSDNDYEKIMESFFINSGMMKKMKSNSIVMHPLPRLKEISSEVDTDSRAAYFRQSQNGIYVRMALLKTVLDA